MTGHHCAAHLHVALLLLLVCVTVSGTFGGAEPARNWRGCVLALPRLFVTPTPQRFEWTNEARDRCGFTAIDLNATAPAVPLTGGGLERLQWLDQRSMTFIGDSTALRMYVYSHNLLVQPAQRIPYSKVAAAPPSMEKTVVLATGAHITLRFFRMMFISTAGDVLPKAFGAPLTGKPGVMFITVGNWDLNWQIQPNMPMPGLDGRVHDWAVAQRYWTKYIDRMMKLIATSLREASAEHRPTVVFREQYLPNCAATRFSGRTRRYRRCPSLLRPVVVPFYRRAVARTAWSIDVPVVSGFIADRPHACTLSDGVHLDFACMNFELQINLNVARLLFAARPSAKATAEGEPALPLSAPYASNATLFDSWWSSFRRDHALTAADVQSAPAPEPAPTSEPFESLADEPAAAPSNAGAAAADENKASAAVPDVSAHATAAPSGVARKPRSGSSLPDFVFHAAIAFAVLALLAAPMSYIFR